MSREDVECTNCGHVYLKDENHFQHDCRNPKKAEGKKMARGFLTYRDLSCKTRSELAGMAFRFGVKYSPDDRLSDLADRILEAAPTFDPDLTLDGAAEMLVDMTQGGSFLTLEEAQEFINMVRGLKSEI